MGYIILELSSACFVMRQVTSLTIMDTLKLVYFAFHCIRFMQLTVREIPKKITTLMAGVKNRDSY